jgi:sulfite reductase (NADPH) flavoprotein alpha-component
MSWNAGDIAVLTPPGSTQREYSIASLPSDGALHILIRQSRRADGTTGVASGWLTGHDAGGAGVGTEVPLRIRPNTNFHAPSDDRPMILIGNGTGIAGLRSHLKARAAAGNNRNWLIFGERNARHDAFYQEDIERWRASGALSRTDFAFSRDQTERVYVQHLIQASAVAVRRWVADGASIYVCGSAEGMAPAVDAALAEALGRETLQQLVVERRYRRDVY